MQYELGTYQVPAVNKPLYILHIYMNSVSSPDATKLLRTWKETQKRKRWVEDMKQNSDCLRMYKIHDSASYPVDKLLSRPSFMAI